LATLLLLTDGRLPAGVHAHSGGIEAAVTAGRVRDVADLERFLRGRLATAGLVAAAFAAAGVLGAPSNRDGGPSTRDSGPSTRDGGSSTRDGGPGLWDDLDAELDARTPSPALRRASRTQGRALLRAGRAMWTLPSTDPNLHHPVALGVVGAAAGLAPVQVALAAGYGAVTGPASAAVKVLALDPYPVHALLARLAGACAEVADRAVAAAARATGPGGSLADLPAAGAPLLDLDAEQHATWEVRLFAS